MRYSPFATVRSSSPDRVSGTFTETTFRCFVVLAAIPTTRTRAVSNVLRTVAARLAPGHPSSDHRVLSTRRWLAWQLGRVLATLILEAWIPEGIVWLSGDDTAEQHRGARIYGKAWHRELFLHRAPLGAQVGGPGLLGGFALDHAALGTAGVGGLIHWFPERKFLFAGDGGFGTYQLAGFARRLRRHLALVSRF